MLAYIIWHQRQRALYNDRIKINRNVNRQADAGVVAAWRPRDEGLLRDTPPSVEPAPGTGEPTDGQPPEGGKRPLEARQREMLLSPAASQMGIMARRPALTRGRARPHLPRGAWHLSQPPASRGPCQEGLSAMRGPSLLPVKWGL